MFVLVVNAGSSSLKYQLFDMETSEMIAKGLCERIGIAHGATLTFTSALGEGTTAFVIFGKSENFTTP